MPKSPILGLHNAITGWPDQVESSIRRSIGQLCRHGSHHQKVGITNDPQRRWNEAYGPNGWEAMFILYKSSRHEHVCTLERRLVDRFEDGLSLTGGYYYNRTGGGGGRKPSIGPYYLYVVNGPKYARITV